MRIFIYGAGRSGIATLNFFQKRGIPCVLYDDKDGVSPDLKGDFTHAFIAPGVPLNAPLITSLREQDVIITNELNFGATLTPFKSVMVTGSNGKGTTCFLIHQLLQLNGIPSILCGNYGAPVLEVLEDFIDQNLKVRAKEPSPILIIEASSYQLELSEKYAPDISIFLNLSPNHLERHGDMEGYFAAKARPFLNQTEDQVAIINLHDPFGLRLKEITKAKVLPIDIENFRDITGFPLKGDHNLFNLSASFQAVTTLGVSNESLLKGLPTLKGLPHRQEDLGTFLGVTWVNDSKATTVAATLESLRRYREELTQGLVILLIGGRIKANSPWEELSLLLNEWGLPVKLRCVLFGEGRSKIKEALGNEAPCVLYESETLKGALHFAAKLATSGDYVVISPGGSSFDEFSDFEARGDFIRNEVKGRSGVTGTATSIR
jgi:UDP-N-acetylmuramoylalanine--D-glutamate ligase